MLLGLGIAILIIAYAYKKHFDSWINPASMFSILWGSILCLYSLKLFNIYNVSNKLLIIYIVGIGSFLIGCFPLKLSFGAVTSCKIDKRSEKRYVFSEKSRLIFLLLSIGAVVILCKRAINTIPFWSIGVSAVKSANVEGDISYTFFESILYTFFASPIELLSVFIVAIDFFFKRGFFANIQLILTILMLLFGYISSGSKFLLLMPIIIFGVVGFTYRYENKQRTDSQLKKSKKLQFWKKILLILFAFVISAFLIYMLSSKYSGWMESLYMYLVGCIPCSAHAIEDMSNGQYYYGMVSLNGLFRVISQIFAFIGIRLPYVSIMNEAYNSMLLYERAIYISPTVTYNAFISMFSYFYKDGGVLGVSIGSFVFGRVSYLGYRKLIIEKSVYSLLLYLYICYLIFFSIVRIQLYLAPATMLLIYIILVFRRKS